MVSFNRNPLISALFSAYLLLSPSVSNAENNIKKARNFMNQGNCKDAVSLLEKEVSANPKDEDSYIELAKAYACDLRKSIYSGIANGNTGRIFEDYANKEKNLERIMHDLSLLGKDFDKQPLSYDLGYLVYGGKMQKSTSFGTPLDAAKTFIYALLMQDDKLLNESKSRSFIEYESRKKEKFQRNLANYRRLFGANSVKIFNIFSGNANEVKLFNQFGNSYIVYSVITKNGEPSELAFIMDKEGSKYKISNIQGL